MSSTILLWIEFKILIITQFFVHLKMYVNENAFLQTFSKVIKILKKHSCQNWHYSLTIMQNHTNFLNPKPTFRIKSCGLKTRWIPFKDWFWFWVYSGMSNEILFFSQFYSLLNLANRNGNTEVNVRNNLKTTQKYVKFTSFKFPFHTKFI